MNPYVALLRGINVGGNKKVPMADLKKLLEKTGYKNVKTLLASGNVVFDSDEKSIAKLRQSLESLIARKFGFPVPVILRTRDDLKKIDASAPFKGIAVTPETRLYVTFLGNPHKSALNGPYKDPKFEFRITRVTSGEVFSVLIVNGDRGTVDAMGFIEKEFGKDVTTRNWNTVQKLL